MTENGTLRAENRALADENKRLADLTRMLLSSPSFSDFLNHLTVEAQPLPQAQPAQPQQQETARQVPKDVNPYAAQQHVQHQQIGLAMIPEQNMDFSILNLDTADTFSYQPQVFAVLETPEPTLDAAMLSGKTSSFAEERFEQDNEKSEMPVIERPSAVKKEEVVAAIPVDEEFESNPAFALYHDSPVVERLQPVELDTDGLSNIDIFGGIEPEKVLARYELVDASEEEVVATLAMAKVERICANMEEVTARLERLTCDL